MDKQRSRRRISLLSLSLLHRPGLDQITKHYNFNINPIFVSVSMVACSYPTLVVIAGVVVAAAVSEGISRSTIGEGTVAIEVAVELGLSVGLSLALEDVAVGGGVGIVAVAVVVDAIGHGVVDPTVVDES